MSKYENLDQALIAVIEGGGDPLYSMHVNRIAVPLANEGNREIFRVIDGRLQALRKSGRLQWSSKRDAELQGVKPGWRVVPSTEKEAA